MRMKVGKMHHSCIASRRFERKASALVLFEGIMSETRNFSED